MFFSEPHELTVIVPALQEPDFSRLLINRTALLKFMNRGARLANRIFTAEQALFEALGYTVMEAYAVPAAHCTFVDDTGEEVYPVTLVDPVHVRAEPDHARLHAAAAIGLQPVEAEQLIAALNEQFSDRGLTFTRGEQQRWYLTGIDGAELRTEPLSRVADRNVVGFITANEHPQHWRQLLTEIQMLLHEHPVNIKRQEEGLMPVNSLWCWGGHAFPVKLMPTALRVYADDAFSRGFARLSAFKTFPVTEVTARVGTCSQIVCVRDLENDVLQQAGNEDDEPAFRATPETVREIDNTAVTTVRQQIEWLDSFLRDAQFELLKGRLAAINLVPCNGRAYRLTRRDLIRFWSTPWSRRETVATRSSD